MSKPIFELNNELAFPISLRATGKKLTVKYGLQVKTGLNYTEACTELGACILHALACEGKLPDEIGREIPE